MSDTHVQKIESSISSDENDSIPLSKWKRKKLSKNRKINERPSCPDETADNNQIKSAKRIRNSSDHENEIPHPKKKFKIQIDLERVRLITTLTDLNDEKSKQLKNCVIPGCQVKDFEGFFEFPKHEFPKNPVTRKIWEKNCGLQEVRSDDLVCYSHFKPSSFDLWPFRLKLSAIPELNLPSSMIRGAGTYTDVRNSPDHYDDWEEKT